MDERGIAADEIHAYFSRHLINRARQFDRIAGSAFRNHRHRRDCYSLVGNSDSEFVADRIDSLNQPVRVAMNFFDGAFGGARNCFRSTVAQTQSQRYGANVKVFHFRHRDGLEDFGLRVFHGLQVLSFKFQVSSFKF